jgi:hypothetical protein
VIHSLSVSQFERMEAAKAEAAGSFSIQRSGILELTMILIHLLIADAYTTPVHIYNVGRISIILSG